MSNIIYCYSASGNCLDMARKIAEGLGDTDIVMMRAFPTVTDATPYERVGFVFPAAVCLPMWRVISARFALLRTPISSALYSMPRIWAADCT